MSKNISEKSVMDQSVLKRRKLAMERASRGQIGNCSKDAPEKYLQQRRACRDHRTSVGDDSQNEGRT